MKKNYIQPGATAISLYTEDSVMLNPQSMKIHDEEGDQMLSGKKDKIWGNNQSDNNNGGNLWNEE